MRRRGRSPLVAAMAGRRTRARWRPRSGPTGRVAARACGRAGHAGPSIRFVLRRRRRGRRCSRPGARSSHAASSARVRPSSRSAARRCARSWTAASWPARRRSRRTRLIDVAPRVCAAACVGFGLGGAFGRSARRRLSRARVSSARAATWLTPRAAASSSPVISWTSARSSAERCRSGIRASARSRSPESRASMTRRSADGEEPRDSPVHGTKRMILRRRISSRATRWAIW